MTHENDRQGGGIARVLREILKAVATASEKRQRREDGTTTVGGTEVDYEFSIEAGHLTDARSEQTRDAGPTDRAIAVRSIDEGVLVAIDAPTIDPEAVSAGTDDTTGELLIAIDETIEERIPLGQRGLEIVDASFTNGVLDLRLHPTEGIPE